MSDVKVEHKAGMTRAELAEWIADVGKALSGQGTVSIRLADTTVDLKVPEQVRVEAELEVVTRNQDGVAVLSGSATVRLDP